MIPLKRSKERDDRKAQAPAKARVLKAPRKSIDRRVREQETRLDEKTKEQRRKRRAAKDVYGAVGFDLMYRDGTCQVEEGLFSETLAFDDISYQSARDEAQQAVFSGWCQLFDYFGSGSSVQLTVTNTPIPASEIGNRTFFEERDPATAGYAREYNKILNDKMREGISNLTRERYLTFATGAASVDEAIPKLARMRNDAEQTLAKIRSSARKLTGEERLKAINGLLRPGAPFVFDWDQVGAMGSLTAKDFVCPDALDFKPDGLGSCYRSDGTWCQVLSLHRFGSELTDRCLAEIIDLPIPLAITIHVQPLDKAASVAFVKR